MTRSDAFTPLILPTFNFKIPYLLFKILPFGPPSVMISRFHTGGGKYSTSTSIAGGHFRRSCTDLGLGLTFNSPPFFQLYREGEEARAFQRNMVGEDDGRGGVLNTLSSGPQVRKLFATILYQFVLFFWFGIARVLCHPQLA